MQDVCLLCPITFSIFPLFSRRLGLNDGVPVEVVLDVVGSEHTSHLEMSRRQRVLLLLLAELTVMACHAGSCVAHGGHVGVSSWWAHQRGNVLSRVHVHVPCADVLVVLVVLSVLTVLAGLRVHGPVGLSRVLRYPWCCRVLDLRLRLWVSGALRGDDPCGGEELVDGRTQICHLSGVQCPVVEFGLSHALLQTLKRGKVYVGPVVAGSDAAALLQPV